MRSSGGFALNVITKALSSPIKDQADVPDQNYSPLNVQSVAMPIVLL